MKDDILAVVYIPQGKQDLAAELVAEVGRDHLESAGEPGKDWDFRFDSEQLFQRFLQSWERLEIDRSEPYVRWLRSYDDNELLEAPFVRLRIDRRSRGKGGPTYGTTFDLSTGCPRCGTGARQVSPLVLNASEVEKKGEITQTLSNERLVSAQLAEVLRTERLSGFELLPTQSTSQERTVPWVQIISTDTLPPMAPETTGIAIENQCPTCRRDGFFNVVSRPEGIVYSRSDVNPANLPDIVTTWEHFGNSVLREPISESRFAQPLFLVKPRVYELLRKHDVRSIVGSPVQVV